MRGSKLIVKHDISKLEGAVFKDGKFQILPFEFWQKFTPEQIQLFCLKYAFYGVPTTDLIEWLKPRIEDKKTIEIGAGNGILAKALNIKAFDNYQQNMPRYTLIYDLTQQPRIKYGANVIEMEANMAVKKTRPKIVIGSWITERYDPLFHEYGGNEIGPWQRDIIKRVETYYLIGNTDVHNNPKVMDLRPIIHQIPLVSRAHNPENNVIFEFKGRK